MTVSKDVQSKHPTIMIHIAKESTEPFYFFGESIGNSISQDKTTNETSSPINLDTLALLLIRKTNLTTQQTIALQDEIVYKQIQNSSEYSETQFVEKQGKEFQRDFSNLLLSYLNSACSDILAITMLFSVIHQQPPSQDSLQSQILRFLEQNLTLQFLIERSSSLLYFMPSLGSFTPDISSLYHILLGNEGNGMCRKNVIQVPSNVRTQPDKAQDLINNIVNKFQEMLPCLELEFVGGVESPLQVVEKNASEKQRAKKKKAAADVVLQKSIKGRAQKIEQDQFTNIFEQLVSPSRGNSILQKLINKEKNKSSSNIIQEEEQILDNDGDDPYDQIYFKESINHFQLVAQVKDYLFKQANNIERAFAQEILKLVKTIDKKQFGLLLPLKSSRSLEKFLVELFLSVYSRPIARKSKILIVSNQNKRTDQIISVIEELLKTYSDLFQFSKHFNQKKYKSFPLKEREHLFKQEIKNNDVFIVLSKKLQGYLQSGDFFITDFDFVFIDEANVTYSEHPYNQIMQEVMYNHDKQMQAETILKLPFVVAAFSFDSMVVESSKDRISILYFLKTLANTFNSSLLMLREEQALAVNRALYQQVIEQRFNNSSCSNSHIQKQHQYNMQFVQKMIEYVTIRSAQEVSVCVEPAPFDKLWQLKKIEDHLYVSTGTAKVTITNSKHVIEVFERFGSKLLELSHQSTASQIEQVKKSSAPQNLQIYKPLISTAQFVQNKIRFFSSRLIINQTLWPTMKYIISQIHSQYHNKIIGQNTGNSLCGFQQYSRFIFDDTESLQSSELFQAIKQNFPDSRVYKFKKKLEAESFIMLEAIFLLHKYGFLDIHLRPNEISILNAIQGKPFDHIKQLSIEALNGGAGKNLEGGKGAASRTNSNSSGGNFSNANKINQPNNNLAQNAGNNANQSARQQDPPPIDQHQEHEAVAIDNKNKSTDKPKIKESNSQDKPIVAKQQPRDLSPTHFGMDDIFKEISEKTVLKLQSIISAQSNRVLSGEIPFQLKKDTKEGILKKTDNYCVIKSDPKQIYECLDFQDQERFNYLINKVQKPYFHKAHADNAIRKLSVFITQILNPILKACNLYESKESDYNIRWWNKDQNMNVDSQLRKFYQQQRASQQHSQQNIKETKKEVNNANNDNQSVKSDDSTKSVDQHGKSKIYQVKSKSYNKFKVYAKVIFNNEQGQQLKENKLYMHLVRMIDIAAENLKMPGHLTKHVSSQYWDPDRRNQTQKEPEFNRKCLLQLLLIALSERDPINLDFEDIKIEIARLSFVGDQVINLVCVISMIFSGETLLTEKDYDAHKNKIINKENLKAAAERFGLQFFKIRPKFTKNYPPKAQQNIIENEQKDRDLADIVQVLAGYFAIYIGFNAAFLFLVEIGIIKSDQQLEVGDNDTSIEQKIAFLNELSNNRKNIISKDLDLSKKKQNLVKLIKDYAVDKIMSPSSLNLSSDQQFSQPNFDRNFSMLKLQVHNAAKCLKSTNLRILQEKLRQSEEDLFASDDSQKEEEAYIILDQHEKNAMEYDDKTNDTLFSDNAFSEQDQENNHSLIPEVEKYTENQEVEKSASQPQQELNNEIFKFKNEDLLLQSIVHSSFTDRMVNSKDQIVSDQPQKQDYLNLLNDKNLMANFNYQILEYLGDSFLNFTVSKLFYIETAEQQQQWHSSYIQAQKLHELKTWFTSNHWLAYAIYENFFFTILTAEESSNFTDERKSLENLIQKVREMKDQPDNDPRLKNLLQKAPRLPLLYNEQDLKFHSQICEFQNNLFKICCFNCPQKYFKTNGDQQDNQQLQEQSLPPNDHPLSDTITVNMSENMAMSEASTAASSNYNQSLHKLKPPNQVPTVSSAGEQLQEIDQIDTQSLSMSSFKEIERKEDEDEDFYSIQESFVKIFSDQMEALIGAIFLDSCDFEKAQVLTLRLLSCKLIDKFPIKQQQRTKVHAIWNSKKYTSGIKLSHSMQHQFFDILYSEEKDDNVYIRGYMNQMEVRRVKFPKDKKKKIPKFYQDFQQYLEESYSKFEEYHIKKQTPELGALQFLEFNKDFRKTFKSSSKVVNKSNEYSIVKEASRRLYLKYQNERIDKLGLLEIEEIKKQLVQVFFQGLIDAKHSESLPSQILVLEQERVRSSKIREFFNRCEIKSINTTAKGVKTLKDFIERLPSKQAYFLYYRLFELADQLIEENNKPKKSKQKGDTEKQGIQQSSVTTL